MTSGLDLGYTFFVDPILVSIEGEQWYPADVRFEDLPYD